jgi:hypothetical protein
LFYNCIDGDFTEVPCTPGLHFEEYQGTCVWPESSGRSGCSKTESECCGSAAALLGGCGFGLWPTGWLLYLTLVRSRTLCHMLNYRTNIPLLPLINQKIIFLKSKTSKIKQSKYFR